LPESWIKFVRGHSGPAHDRKTPIVEIGGVPDVARSMGLAETTIKTHLARIFTKTGTKRQADLVRLVAAFTPPNKV
jgi:regulatory LuxR family protein